MATHALGTVGHRKSQSQGCNGCGRILAVAEFVTNPHLNRVTWSMEPFGFQGYCVHACHGVRVCAYVYAFVNGCVCMRGCARTCVCRPIMRVRLCACMFECVHVWVHVWVHMFTFVCVRTRARARVCVMHAHVRMRVCIRVYSHMWHVYVFGITSECEYNIYTRINGPILYFAYFA